MQVGNVQYSQHYLTPTYFFNQPWLKSSPDNLSGHQRPYESKTDCPGYILKYKPDIVLKTCPIFNAGRSFFGGLGTCLES